MYRGKGARIEVFLVHPGGPFSARKDAGSWSIPKGEYSGDEKPLDAAKREFREETGFTPGRKFIALGDVKQRSGKIVAAWAFEGDCDPEQLRSNVFSMEWPPRSGRQITVPEVDRGGWFSIDEAAIKLKAAQCAFLDRLVAFLA
jgi:predicted NUDIX family NTP pyrophosphohydrolase